MSHFRTRNQSMAEAVFKRVAAIELGSKAAKRYGAMAHRLPVLIRSAGLAQALAFVQVRGKQEQKQLLDDLAFIIGQENGLILQKASYSASLTEYMHLTQVCLAALLWFKRYAQSVLKVDATEDAGDDHDGE
ncbi:MAG: type III-B CRISPR module-associated protein Cmr5 [Roseiflexaceae bacterium]|nr:type III-B CRISPR module-associated protein Cmr5 [Roseiflexaceae bacterium]